MKFLIDENLGIQVPHYLRSLGFDVISISELSPGISDEEVLTLANTENRVLITLDKDFGELVFKERLVHSGVILLRLKDESVENKKKILERTMKSTKSYLNKFTVVKG